MLYVLPWGYLYGPKCLNFELCDCSPLIDQRLLSLILPFNLPKTPAIKRIGPHNIDVISVIIGNMLGDGWAENRSNNTRFHIHLGSPNVKYLMCLHKFFSERGYCTSKKPKLKRNIALGNKNYFSYKFRTWTFSNLNWIYKSFYKNKVKVVPNNIQDLLSPLALAVWIMAAGGVHPSGMILSTYNFGALGAGRRSGQ